MADTERAVLTDSELAQIATVIACATPGEWRMVMPSGSPAISIYAQNHTYIATLVGGNRTGRQDHKMRNAAFIAAARTDMPRLVAELQQARAAIRDVLLYEK